ncbi:imidazoleglycerol-phosphate dehydratase HisB [Aliikangiella coralliicola]|uniref:Imidazoleglycerol-phosphate dehydratase n=1 Tax=Aliikangiella coralliicola TaxID=2592383 RepID=A0A545UGZ9_9GAMM|nr:imidazoleglycerol-phosphate dehydratase HisB [Aliikangiella coralliicola]TQV88748.1 imidazoleglycerol-phosphate dehydratase HisB [Aliikangiella coralliicola]
MSTQLNNQLTNTVEIERQTKETNIALALNISGSQQININTGIGFLDHMLQQLASHARWDLDIQVKGDLEVDDHHTVEDIAICLGDALQQSWRNLSSMQRYGQRLLPMDEALIMCAVDLSGRGIYVGDLEFSRENLGGVSTEMFEHFFRTLASSAAITLHINPMYYRNNHHLAEGCFKAVAYALKEALGSATGENTTKGML